MEVEVGSLIVSARKLGLALSLHLPPPTPRAAPGAGCENWALPGPLGGLAPTLGAGRVAAVALDAAAAGPEEAAP
eukprot:11225894-Lingulodinium_polyedra.AAC.1